MRIKYYADQKSGISIGEIGKELGYDTDAIYDRLHSGQQPTKKERDILVELLSRLGEFEAMPLREFKALAKREREERERKG